MTGWAKKVFWQDVTTQAGPDGHAVLLDGRPLRTPVQARLLLPTHALAALVAEEWRAQDGVIRPDTMPATRSANVAIDKVSAAKNDVVAVVAAYGETDLLCYRATAPAALRAEQAVAWDPLLDWAAARYGVTWTRVDGVMPAPQPPRTVQRLTAEIATLTAFELTALHELVALSGSLIIGLAVLESQAAPEVLWQASRLDEDWQARQWGADEEAQANAALRREGFLQARRFLVACRAA